MEEKISNELRRGAMILQKTCSQSPQISACVNAIVSCLKEGKKVLIMGNGGSASQASHVAGELVGRFKRERKGLACIALTTDTAILTALGNDYGYEKIFVRQIESLAQKGDVVIGLSTSGNSANVISALALAKELGCTTVTLTGKDGGDMKNADVNIHIDSQDTPHVQEAHIAVLHIICDLVEEAFS